MRQCLDTNVLVRASLSKGGPARRLLDLIITQHDHTLVLSDYILDEVRDVLARPHIQRFSPQSGKTFIGIHRP